MLRIAPQCGGTKRAPTPAAHSERVIDRSVPFHRPARDSFLALLARCQRFPATNSLSATLRPAPPILSVVCMYFLSACTMGTVPRELESIPAELIPSGYSAADCRITELSGGRLEAVNAHPMTSWVGLSWNAIRRYKGRSPTGSDARHATGIACFQRMRTPVSSGVDVRALPAHRSSYITS